MSSKKVVLVGVGGATCSGKTTLAKHLKRILPNSVIIHQDDFAPPQDRIPDHPRYKVKDWDAAPGAIDWPRLIDFLRKVHETGEIPADHRSHDHLNEQKDIPISDAVRDQWISAFNELERDSDVIWGLVDGFLLYWHPDVIDQLDVRIFLRVPHDTLRDRRHARHGYHTAVQSDLEEGTVWRDPPRYWEDIVYPAYVEANRKLFDDGDVENGALTEEVAGLVLLEGVTMDEAVSRSLEAIMSFSG